MQNQFGIQTTHRYSRVRDACLGIDFTRACAILDGINRTCEEKACQPVEYDLIIAGGGPAGLTAGLYAARGKLQTLLVEKMLPGGQAASTFLIENYPGFPQGIAGPELAQAMEAQARRFGLESAFGEVKKLQRQGTILGSGVRRQDLAKQSGHYLHRGRAGKAGDPRGRGFEGERSLLLRHL